MILKRNNFRRNFCDRNKIIKYISIALFFTLTPAIGCLNPIKINAQTDAKLNKNIIENTAKILESKNDNKQNINNNINNIEKQNNNNLDEKEKEKEEILKNIKEKKDFNIKVLKNNKEEKMSFLEYVRGCVASEIGSSAPEEAKKAQKALCITYAIKNRGLNGVFPLNNSFQTYIPKDERIKRYGEEKEKELEKLITIDSLEVLLYGDEICETLYDTCVGGCTRPNEDVFHKGDKKYHINSFPGVKSPEQDLFNKISSIKDENKKKEFITNELKVNPSMIGVLLSYLQKNEEKTFELEINNAFNTVKQFYKDATMPTDNTKIIENITYDRFGYVEKIKIFGVEISGEFCRRNFKLSSAQFKTEIKDTKIIFKCLGSGHGCGLSQVGAVVKAIVEKKNCLEILKHYFADEKNQNKISLKSLKDVNPKLLFKN